MLAFIAIGLICLILGIVLPFENVTEKLYDKFDGFMENALEKIIEIFGGEE